VRISQGKWGVGKKKKSRKRGGNSQIFQRNRGCGSNIANWIQVPQTSNWSVTGMWGGIIKTVVEKHLGQKAVQLVGVDVSRSGGQKKGLSKGGVPKKPCKTIQLCGGESRGFDASGGMDSQKNRKKYREKMKKRFGNPERNLRGGEKVGKYGGTREKLTGAKGGGYRRIQNE